MRILVWSNSSWTCTGYGVQTNLFAPRIQGLGHEVGIFAFYGLEGRVLNVQGPRGGIPVYPRFQHPYGVDVAGAHAQHFQADILLSLMDAWVIRPDLLQGVRWVPWYPVDSEPLPPPVRDAVAKGYRRIVFSRFGERMTKEAGLDCYYVPHGVDTNEYHPLPMSEARERLKWDADRYIVSIVAANKGAPSRKAFYPQFRAFAAFHKKHPDTLLYVHSNTAEHGENGGENLPEMAKYVGLEVGKDITFNDQYLNQFGYPDAYLNDVYNASDVKMLVSMGEGFGVPILEAQAAGCPVIVGDWTAMSELCFAGWKVDKREAEPFHTPLNCDQYYPRWGAILDRLDAAYEMRGNMDYRKRARDGAVKYDADKITADYWQPVLADIEKSVNLWKKPGAK